VSDHPVIPPRLESPRSPNWDYWCGLPSVTVHDAVMLSLEYNPAFFAAGVKFDPGESDYFDRLDIAYGQADAGTFPSAKDSLGNRYCRLADFAMWAAEYQPLWALPVRLLELAHLPERRATRDHQDGGVRSAEKQAKANPPWSEDLDRRERTSLLVIIAALAKKADVQISKPNPAAKAISALVRKEFKARIAVRTIEKHLKMIDDALDRRDPDED